MQTLVTPPQLLPEKPQLGSLSGDSPGPVPFSYRYRSIRELRRGRNTLYLQVNS